MRFRIDLPVEQLIQIDEDVLEVLWIAIDESPKVKTETIEELATVVVHGEGDERLVDVLRAVAAGDEPAAVIGLLSWGLT